MENVNKDITKISLILSEEGEGESEIQGYEYKVMLALFILTKEIAETSGLTIKELMEDFLAVEEMELEDIGGNKNGLN